TWIHCGSLKALDQRVPLRLPSTARSGVVPTFSLDEALAGRPCESSTAAARTDREGSVLSSMLTSTTSTSAASRPACAGTPAALRPLQKPFRDGCIASPFALYPA